MIKTRNKILVSLLQFVFVWANNAYSIDVRNNSVLIPIKNHESSKVKLVKINVCSDSIVQVIVLPANSATEPESLMVEKRNWKKVDFNVKEKGNEIIITTKKLKLVADNNTGKIIFKDINDSIILKEGDREISPAQVLSEKTFNIKQHFIFAQNEALYGLGQHQEGTMNWRGHYVELFQYNMRIVIPFLLSTKGYGILWDNYSYTKFNDNQFESYLWSEVADAINYYFVYGPELDEVISGYRIITGKAPMFPKWVFGYIQSKERYKTQEELLSIAREYRERKIPMDVLVQDWRYWQDGMWGQKSFDKSRFPDPSAMMEQLHKDYNIHLMISIWPSMAPKSYDYQEMVKHPGFLYSDKESSCYDAFNEKARALYWKQANEGLFRHGIDAWWCDATEPEFLGGWDFCNDYFRTQMKPYIGSGARYMNAYSLMQTKGMYENQRQVTSEKRVFIMTRSCYAGQQRYAAATWSGDIVANWDVFKAQIPAGLNFCMSGVPYWNTDIGGFFVQSAQKGELGKGMWGRNGSYDLGLSDDNYKELYVRWFQYGAFCPLFRAHGTDVPREIWQFGQPGHWAYDALLKFDQLRYRLMPYIYSTAWMVTNDDYTMMRGLAMDFRNDSHVFDIDDQFMFGTSLMVNPVTAPKATYRNVYLPIGSDWYNFWTGKKYSGGQTIPVPTPIDQIPVFVKAGSIIPLGPVIQYATEMPQAPVELRIYAGADAVFNLYEDENDNYNYESGKYTIIPIVYSEDNKTLTIEERKGQFPGMIKDRLFKIAIVKEGQGTDIGLVQNPDNSINYDGKKQVIKLE
ncbi:MAG: glycoside hydrolase family 31 protein [Sedimentisphaerales bacterium]